MPRPTRVLACLCLLLATSASAAGSLARVRKAGRLLAACDLTYPPMAYEDAAGHPAGYSVDVAKEVGRRLGVQTQYVVMSWDGILAGLASKRYDAIICTMNVTPEREKVARFVEFVRLAQVFVSRPGHEVRTPSDLAGKVVAVQADTTSQSFVEAQAKKGIKPKSLLGLKLATDAFAALRAGHADVIVVDEPVARFYVKQEPKAFVVSGRAMAPEPVGIALAKDDAELAAAVSDAVKAMRQDGFFKRLSLSWFGAELGQ